MSSTSKGLFNFSMKKKLLLIGLGALWIFLFLLAVFLPPHVVPSAVPNKVILKKYHSNQKPNLFVDYRLYQEKYPENCFIYGCDPPFTVRYINISGAIDHFKQARYFFIQLGGPLSPHVLNTMPDYNEVKPALTNYSFALVDTSTSSACPPGFLFTYVDHEGKVHVDQYEGPYVAQTSSSWPRQPHRWINVTRDADGTIELNGTKVHLPSDLHDAVGCIAYHKCAMPIESSTFSFVLYYQPHPKVYLGNEKVYTLTIDLRSIGVDEAAISYENFWDGRTKYVAIDGIYYLAPSNMLRFFNDLPPTYNSTKIKMVWIVHPTNLTKADKKNSVSSPYHVFPLISTPLPRTVYLTLHSDLPVIVALLVIVGIAILAVLVKVT